MCILEHKVYACYAGFICISFMALRERAAWNMPLLVTLFVRATFLNFDFKYTKQSNRKDLCTATGTEILFCPFSEYIFTPMAHAALRRCSLDAILISRNRVELCHDVQQRLIAVHLMIHNIRSGELAEQPFGTINLCFFYGF